jgi:xanthine dehydrogenase accessory factor
LNWRVLLDAAERGDRVALCTVVGVDGSAPRAAGARMLVWADGRTEGTVGGGNFEHQVIRVAIEALAEGKPRRFSVHLTRDLGMCCGGAMDVYIEPVEPAERAVVFGAGHVAKPTVALLVEMGFHVTVVDERDEWATPERFPGAEVICTDPRRYVAELGTDEHTWLLLVTHDHKLDQDLLQALIGRRYAWLGLIGSRAKAAKFFVRLRAAGVDEALFQRVSTPVGLDLGAETPAEIAVSIAAEIVRVRRRTDRPPVPLSEIPLAARASRSGGRSPNDR